MPEKYQRLRDNAQLHITISKHLVRVKTNETYKSNIEARNRGEVPLEGDNMYIDYSIIPYLEEIFNKNKHIITTMSCSGRKHSKDPLLMFIATDKKGRKYAELLSENYQVSDYLNPIRAKFFKDNYPEYHIINEYSVLVNKSEYPVKSLKRAKEIWEDWTKILTSEL